ncbi:MAG: regulator of sigma protease [Thermotogota bacterium]|nr:regulator of sigma protease [Thermotogota bacterium]HCZ06319.1 peptidase M50 [Thermotogota bacterium]
MESGEIMEIIIFLLVLTGVITVHELGHFLFAKLFKVRVLEFAIGFGPKLFGIEKGETLYRVNVFPVGGYVRMKGEDVLEEDRSPDSFMAKPAWQRFLIAFAGPLFSILAGYVLLAIVAVGWGFPSVILERVEKDFPAYSMGLRPGDRVVEVNGRVIIETTDLSEAVERGKPLDLLVERDGKRFRVQVAPVIQEMGFVSLVLKTLEAPGDLEGAHLKSVGGYVLSSSTIDRIRELSGRVVEIEADGVSFRAELVSFNSTGPRYILGISYATLAPVFARDVGPFRAGDRLLSIGGMEIKDSVDLSDAVARLQLASDEIMITCWGERVGTVLRGFPEEGILVEVVRNGQVRRFTLDKKELLELLVQAAVFKEAYPYWRPENPFEALRMGFIWANKLLKTMIEFVQRLFTGRESAGQIVGPVGIVNLMSEASKAGLKTSLVLIAIITLNLGIFNMIPLPALDGGRMVFALVEIVLRKRVPPKVESYIHALGFLLLMFLMIYITFIDVLRLVR